MHLRIFEALISAKLKQEQKPLEDGGRGDEVNTCTRNNVEKLQQG